MVGVVEVIAGSWAKWQRFASAALRRLRQRNRMGGNLALLDSRVVEYT